MISQKTLHVKAGLKAGKIATNHSCAGLRVRPASKGGRHRSAIALRGGLKAPRLANDNHVPLAAAPTPSR
jgi:hypothetical protein